MVPYGRCIYTPLNDRMPLLVLGRCTLHNRKFTSCELYRVACGINCMTSPWQVQLISAHLVTASCSRFSPPQKKEEERGEANPHLPTTHIPAQHKRDHGNRTTQKRLVGTRTCLVFLLMKISAISTPVHFDEADVATTHYNNTCSNFSTSG